ncbi:MAG: SPASM domain-containing protein, partial [Burkholderiaceae bacterium]|nr:SPASM domain-containing protein [Burkholderiaceae bacterium]
ARQAGLAIVFQTTVFEENRHDLAALADLAQRQGAMAFNVFFLVCTGRGVTQTDLGSESYEEVLREIVQLQQIHPGLKIRARCAPYMRRVQGLQAGQSSEGFADWSSACLAGRRYFRITAQGQITPCPYIPDVAGDLRRESLATIWETHPVFHRLRNEVPTGKCGKCDYRYSCGGCRARALARYGDVMAEDPKCDYVTPQEFAAEAPAAVASSSLVAWQPEAEQRLQRIPAFVRAFVKARVEQHAVQQGMTLITAEFLAARRPAVLPTIERRPQ